MSKSARKLSAARATGDCLCGAVRIEIAVPVFWAWHDHSKASQRAQGCAYATYVGCWKSKLRVVKGGKSISHFEEPRTHAVRLYHIGLDDAPEWEYHGEVLAPLKGYPGVRMARPKRRKTQRAPVF